jgi:hypothetical protein
MACNKCGTTKSSPCACQDHGLTTPCSYYDCTDYDAKTGHPEHCGEIYCTDCIKRCRNSIQAPNGAGQYLFANNGDKLDTIVQRMFLFATQPACYDLSIPHLWHDPELTTTTTVTLKWDSIPTGVNAIDVEYATMAGGWQLDTAVDLASNVVEYTVGNVLALVPNTTYKFRLVSNNGACTSVELIVTTLAP